LKVWKIAEAFRLVFPEGAEFLIDPAASRLWCCWRAPLTWEDAAAYLLGPVVGLLLALRGITCLHSSAVAVGGRALALLGPSGAGKSTLAAALAQRGLPVLTDDVVALTGAPPAVLVQPGYPRLRLWPDSAQILYGAADALPPLTPTWDKCYVDLTDPAYRFQRRPLPLAAVYALAWRGGAAAPPLAPLSPREAFVVLASNRYFALPQAEARARAFDLLGQVVARVPVRRVVPPADPARLPALCDAILADFQTLPSALPS
jgi:hypothetical protein